MKSFLLGWNPKNWEWSDLPDAVYKVETGESYESHWTCRSKNVKIGDRFFLMRLGNDPKGIIGSGQVQSEPYDKLHYDNEKAAEGVIAPRVDIHFDCLSTYPIISENELKNNFKGFNWFPQQSGVSIPDDISNKLQDLLDKRTEGKVNLNEKDEFGKILEGKPKKITITSYDRSQKARQECIKHYGLTCVVCGFNFQKTYGDIGKGFIYVHHLRGVADIASETEIDPIEALRPVCANCHAMLHKERPAYSIDDIKKFMNK